MGTNDKKEVKIGAISHTIKNLRTSVFLKMFLVPNLATPIPSIAPTLSCTKEVGIPLNNDAPNSSDAEIKAIITASTLPKRNNSLPVFRNILSPNIELPIPKLGATTIVAIIIIRVKILPEELCIPSSFNVIVVKGPLALATLFAPMEKATYIDIPIIAPLSI